MPPRDALASLPLGPAVGVGSSPRGALYIASGRSLGQQRPRPRQAKLGDVQVLGYRPFETREANGSAPLRTD